MDLFVISAATLLVAAATAAVWRAWQAEKCVSQEAAARAEAEERARKEAERASQEAAARAKAEERARKEAERAQREAERARNAERRAAKLGSEVAEARVDAARRVDERTLVNALRKSLPALETERAKRLENQLESLARLRERAEKLREELTAASDEEVRGPLREKLSKVESDAEALITRLRNVVAEDPALSGVRLSLAWGARVSTKKKEEK